MELINKASRMDGAAFVKDYMSAISIAAEDHKILNVVHTYLWYSFSFPRITRYTYTIYETN